MKWASLQVCNESHHNVYFSFLNFNYEHFIILSLYPALVWVVCWIIFHEIQTFIKWQKRLLCQFVDTKKKVNLDVNRYNWFAIVMKLGYLFCSYFLLIHGAIRNIRPPLVSKKESIYHKLDHIISIVWR